METFGGSSEFYKLAYFLGKGIVNIVDIRFPLAGELGELKKGIMQRTIDLYRQKGWQRLDIPFERAVSDYRQEELLIKDTKKSRSARIVWSLWIGLLDIHFYNSHTVNGVPVDFDFNMILSPYKHVQDIDLDRVTSLMLFSLLLNQNEEMDSYHFLEGYDLPTIGKTIQSIIDFDKLKEGVFEINYPSGSWIGDISNVNHTFHFFDDKRANNGRWLWNATALALSKFTGLQITPEELKRISNLNSGCQDSIENRVVFHSL